ncbi:MAG: class I SAM-dependent methyltransferase [Okeania sp. SIO3C4]|nr:class I SAM-dependent methyltransferase [Okeania sp. SIO3C4]
MIESFDGNKNNEELHLQDSFPWQRGKFYGSYEELLGRYIVQSVLENMRPMSLLDLACGNGLLTNMMAPYFNRVVGVDASKTHIAEAKSCYPDIEFIRSLAEDYMDDNGFDTITMVTLLEHVQDPSNLLRACAKNLASKGILIAHVPNAAAINRRISKIMGSLSDEYELSPFDLNVAGHRRSYDLSLLIQDFHNAGFEVVKTGGVFYKMLSTPQINWFLENGPWEEGGFGWGRVGEENSKDWRQAFCDACYEFGKERAEDCNVIYAVGRLKNRIIE